VPGDRNSVIASNSEAAHALRSGFDRVKFEVDSFVRTTRDRLASKSRYAAATIREPRILLGRKRYILLLSHPRCYTSLIAHILGSHPEIVGSCETYSHLRNGRDLIRLRYLTYWLNGRKIPVRYVFDKILVHYISLSSEILNRDDVTVLFALRGPERTIPSMTRFCFDESHRGRVAFAGDFYINALQSLEQRCLALKKPAFYFDGSDVVTRTADLLKSLEWLLGLNQHLSERYQTFRHTGIEGGDPSGRIKCGSINRTEDDYHEIVVPDDLMQRAQASYEHCRSLLRERCICF
jgi:hypothetical protein